MKDSKRTSSFLEAINKYAQQQSEEIRLEAAKIKQEAVDKATQEGINDAYKLIQKEISTKKAEIVSEIAKEEYESRTRLFEKRKEIVNKVFDEAVKKLEEFTVSDEYLNFLKSSAEKIKAEFGEKSCTVYISDKDADKSQIISSVIEDCIILNDSSIKIGGIKAYCEDLSIILDDTLDTRLREQKLWFTENSGLKVV